MEKPTFHITLDDQDRWAVEAKQHDGTLECVQTFQDHATAASWVVEHSESWFRVRRIYLRHDRSGAESRAGPRDIFRRNLFVWHRLRFVKNYAKDKVVANLLKFTVLAVSDLAILHNLLPFGFALS
jgi:hypothetical protein